jgi:hypothetical protein
MFANAEVCLVESAFKGVQAVLKKNKSSLLTVHVPNLTTMYLAGSLKPLKRYKEIAQERPCATSQYLDQILMMDFQDSHDQQYMTPTFGDAEISGLEVDRVENCGIQVFLQPQVF